METQNLQEEKFRVYVQTDEEDRITAVNSSAFVPPEWGIEIDAGYGDRYHHAQSHYFDGPVCTVDGELVYLWDGEKANRKGE